MGRVFAALICAALFLRRVLIIAARVRLSVQRSHVIEIYAPNLLFSKAALARRVFRTDKIGAESAPKHAPWKAGFTHTIFEMTVKPAFHGACFSRAAFCRATFCGAC